MSEHRDLLPAGVPDEHRAAAEHVRAHLVFLRGGAPFLSPADAVCMVDWLDGNVSVTRILAALDRCAASRRRGNARVRFSLMQAKRHLDKTPLTHVEPPSIEADHPLDGVAEELAHLPLTKQLRALPRGAVVEAVALCRGHIERCWDTLEDAERSERLTAAIQTLGDLPSLVDEATLAMLAEEVARDRFRAELPRVDTARIAGLMT